MNLVFSLRSHSSARDYTVSLLSPVLTKSKLLYLHHHQLHLSQPQLTNQLLHVRTQPTSHRHHSQKTKTLQGEIISLTLQVEFIVLGVRTPRKTLIRHTNHPIASTRCVGDVLFKLHAPLRSYRHPLVANHNRSAHPPQDLQILIISTSGAPLMYAV